MQNYIVIFSYAIPICANNEREAESLAIEQWAELDPRPDEMNIEIEKE